jgi:hypothetical protein
MGVGRPDVYDAQDHGSEAEWRACPVCHPTETPADVFRALLEMYRQAGQDSIHAEWGESWPTHKERESEELHELHTECARWLSRYEAAAGRRQTQRAGMTGEEER